MKCPRGTNSGPSGTSTHFATSRQFCQPLFLDLEVVVVAVVASVARSCSRPPFVAAGMYFRVRGPEVQPVRGGGSS